MRKWVSLHIKQTGILILNPRLPGPRYTLVTYNPKVYDILFPQFTLKQKKDAQNLAVAQLPKTVDIILELSRGWKSFKELS